MTVDMAVPAAENFCDAPARQHGDSGTQLLMSVWESAESARAMQAWKELEQRIGPVAISCSRVWIQSWLDHYGDLIPHRFVVGQRAGKVCGICLLTEGRWEKDGPVRIKTLHVGTAGERDDESVCVEFNQILAELDCHQEFVRGLLDLVNLDARWEEFRLDGFLQTDAKSLLALGDWIVSESKSYYFDLKKLRDSSDDVFTQWKARTRMKLRQKIKAFGPVEIEWAETIDQAQSILSDLVRLHQARWTGLGKPGVYASERFLQFHRDLIRRALPEGKVAMIRVTQDGQLVGCRQFLIDRNRVLCYQGGWDPCKSKLSPGVVLYYYCIVECLQRGFDAYDFMVGENHSKQSLATNSNTLIWARLRRPSLKFQVVDCLRRLQHLLRRPASVGKQLFEA